MVLSHYRPNQKYNLQDWFNMKKMLLTPQPGFRFTIDNLDHVFEVTSVSYGMVRYAAVAGGKPFTILFTDFESRYQSGEIQCTFAPEKMIVNPEQCASITRKERYTRTAILRLFNPTAFKQLQIIIQEVAAEIDDATPPSPRTVARWIHQYRRSHHNMLSLSTQLSGNRTLRFSPEVYQILSRSIEEVYLKPEHRTSKDVQANMLGKFLEQNISTQHMPSLRMIQRYINKLDPYVVMKVKQGSRIAQKHFQAAGISTPSPFVLYYVEIDTHYLDIIIIDLETGEPLGRPFLVCAIDVHTRVIVGTFISMFPPSAMTTLAVIRDMITRPNRGLPGGIPSIIIPDNGVEFKNNALARVCNHLKITITPSQIGTPNNKPHIERFFGTLTTGILQKLPGTTFSNPTERGSYDSSSQAKLTLQQVKKYVDEWINTVYHQAIHSSTGRAPILMWSDATQHVKPSFLTEIDADIICRRPLERNIHHGQVTIDGLAYYSHALTTLTANGIKKVIVLIDDLDLSKVYILHPDEKDIVIQADSTNLEYTKGLSHHTHLEVQKRKKLMTELDRQKLGKFADLYHLYSLMQDIQTDLVRNKPKLRQFKLQLPQKLKELEQLKKSQVEIPIPDICSTPLTEDIQNPAHPTVFESLEVSKDERL